VCWRHNWEECPLEVLELKSVVGRLQLDVGMMSTLPQTGTD